MIVPSPGSTVSELIAGLAPPVSGGGVASAGGAAVAVSTAAGVSTGAGAAGSSLPPQALNARAAITHARARGSSRTVEPRTAGGHLDRPQQVAQEARLGVGLLGMPHCGVHRAAAIVAVAPGQRTRLVEAGEHVRSRWRAELVPLVAAFPWV